MTTLLPFIVAVPLLFAAILFERDPASDHTEERPPNTLRVEAETFNPPPVVNETFNPGPAPSALAEDIPPSDTTAEVASEQPAPSQRVTGAVYAAGDNDAWTREAIEAYICTFPWPCVEALYVAGVESGFRAGVWNWEGSGACGLFQLLPCACIDVECNVGHAYGKWEDGDGIQDNSIGNFERHWYRWWPQAVQP